MLLLLCSATANAITAAKGLNRWAAEAAICELRHSATFMIGVCPQHARRTAAETAAVAAQKNPAPLRSIGYHHYYLY